VRIQVAAKAGNDVSYPKLVFLSLHILLYDQVSLQHLCSEGQIDIW
jgi:hypothetical protein